MKKFTNKELITLLKEVLAAMEVKQVNKFRIRAYQNVISSIESLTLSVFDLWENNRLDEVPGVGDTLKQHLTELFTNGKVKDFDSICHDLPQGMFSLIGLRGIGAKKAFKLAHNFKLNNRETAVEKIKELAESHKIQVLEGFGEKSEKDILDAITESKMHKSEKVRLLLHQAEEVACRLKDYMSGLPDVLDTIPLGSLRRRASTVGDLDIAVSSYETEKVLDYFTRYPEVAEIISKGEKKIQAVLKNDIQVDLRVSPPEALGAMLQYFTGSKQHNVFLRTYGLEKGMSLSEYGIKKNEKLHEFATEEAFYKFIGLDYIVPELRQGKHEIELSKSHKLPDLVSLKDIKGDIHTHTTDSDGVNTLEEMVAAASNLGYEYYGIADHAPSVQSRGISEVLEIIADKRERISKLNKKYPKMKLLFGYEVNILTDGTLGLPDEALKLLDYVVASIHSSFDQKREQVTQRVLNALENPYVNVIGHPSGRLINQRQGCDFDWRKIFLCAAENQKIIEINAQPNRLDLPDDLVPDATAAGVKLMINTDSHDTSSLNLMSCGLDVARRGFCTPKEIINTLPLDEFLRVLKARV